MLKLNHIHKSIIFKLLLFFFLFLTVSGITGSWIVSTRLLYDFGFFIYANLGKMVFISTIIFILLIRNKIKMLNKLPKPKTNILYIIFSLFLIPMFFRFGNTLLEYRSPTGNLQLFFATHLLLLFIPTFLLTGIMGWGFLKAFFKNFKKEVLICIAVSVAYDLAIFQVWKLWSYFSNGVLQSLNFLASLTSANVLVVKPRVLVVNNFAVAIEESCSGLDSIFLFTTLYLLIGVLDFGKFNKTKLIGMFVPALLGLYVVNILRVYTLVTIGAYISADLSIKLFHTYLGMLLFIIFFLAFWKLSFKWMQK